jgi:hypothetical protein
MIAVWKFAQINVADTESALMVSSAIANQVMVNTTVASSSALTTVTAVESAMAKESVNVSLDLGENHVKNLLVLHLPSMV